MSKPENLVTSTSQPGYDTVTYIISTDNSNDNLWTGPGTIAAFMIGFTLFMFMFILVIRVSLALTRASLDRRVRPRSPWVTIESGRIIRDRRGQTAGIRINGSNQLMTDAPPSYNDVCFSPPDYQSSILSPVQQQNKPITE